MALRSHRPRQWGLQCCGLQLLIARKTQTQTFKPRGRPEACSRPTLWSSLWPGQLTGELQGDGRVRFRAGFVTTRLAGMRGQGRP